MMGLVCFGDAFRRSGLGWVGLLHCFCVLFHRLLQEESTIGDLDTMPQLKLTLLSDPEWFEIYASIMF
jgi:hypothetical protein